MLIVAIDTSGKNGSVAVMNYRDDGLSGHLEPLTGGAYSAELIPKLQALLQRENRQPCDIEAFAVSSGPGSFTGLRVGLSTVKALADALARPIAAVSAFEAVAALSNAEGKVLVALDAGRKQVYVGEFDLHGSTRTAGSERLLDLDQLAAELNATSPPIFTADANVAESLRSSGATLLVPAPQADLYARLGAEHILAGKTVSPAELDANYIRRSDAELFQAPR